MVIIKVSALKELIKRRLEAVLIEQALLTNAFKLEDSKRPSIDHEAIELVSRTLSFASPVKTNKFYKIAQSMSKHKHETSVYSSQEEFYTDLADAFLNTILSSDDEDSKESHISQKDFHKIDKVEFGKAVEQHFSG